MGTYDFNWFHINSRVTGHHAFTNWSSSGDLEITSLHWIEANSPEVPANWWSNWSNARDSSYEPFKTANLRTGSILDSQEASLQKFGSMTLKSDACLQLLNPLRTPSHIQLCLATGLAGKTGTVATLSSFCLIWEDPKTKIGRQNDGKTAKTMPGKWNHAKNHQWQACLEDMATSSMRWVSLVDAKAARPCEEGDVQIYRSHRHSGISNPI